MSTSSVCIGKVVCNSWYVREHTNAPNPQDHLGPLLHAHDVWPDPPVGAPSGVAAPGVACVLCVMRRDRRRCGRISAPGRRPMRISPAWASVAPGAAPGTHESVAGAGVTYTPVRALRMAPGCCSLYAVCLIAPWPRPTRPRTSPPTSPHSASSQSSMPQPVAAGDHLARGYRPVSGQGLDAVWVARAQHTQLHASHRPSASRRTPYRLSAASSPPEPGA